MYAVTRQSYWPNGDQVVEVAEGGIEYCNPDALCQKYVGEFKEFEDPREAVETAIGILKAWRNDSKHPRKIHLAIGSTGGYTMPFEHITIREALKAAKQIYESLPKCDQCGGLLGKSTYTHEFADDQKFCREYCAEKNYEQYVEEEDD